jgi:hypothetical protein
MNAISQQEKYESDGMQSLANSESCELGKNTHMLSFCPLPFSRKIAHLAAFLLFNVIVLDLMMLFGLHLPFLNGFQILIIFGMESATNILH